MDHRARLEVDEDLETSVEISSGGRRCPTSQVVIVRTPGRKRVLPFVNFHSFAKDIAKGIDQRDKVAAEEE